MINTTLISSNIEKTGLLILVYSQKKTIDNEIYPPTIILDFFSRNGTELCARRYFGFLYN